MELKYPYLECGYFLIFGDQYNKAAQTLPLRIYWKEEIADYATARNLLPDECYLCAEADTAMRLWMNDGSYPAYLKADEPYPTFFLYAEDCLYPVGYNIHASRYPAYAASGSEELSSGSGLGVGSGSGLGVGSGSGAGIGSGSGLEIGSGSGAGIGSGSGLEIGSGSGAGIGSGSGAGIGSGSGAAVCGDGGETGVQPDNLRNSDGGWHLDETDGAAEGGYGLNLI